MHDARDSLKNEVRQFTRPQPFTRMSHTPSKYMPLYHRNSAPAERKSNMLPLLCATIFIAEYWIDIHDIFNAIYE